LQDPASIFHFPFSALQWDNTGQWRIEDNPLGWFIILLGLFRMFAPELQLKAAQNTSAVIPEIMMALAVGIFLTFKAYGSRK
jgi:hypothetical protein